VTSDVFLIEVGRRAVGLVARNPGDSGFRFHAATPELFPLDGKCFGSPGEAEHAARRMIEEKPAAPPRRHAA
jgi:hypothetical protein